MRTEVPPGAPPGAPPRRLSRSRRERLFAGVAGGIAEYFDLDPVVVRLLWVAAAVLTYGLAIPAYVVMMLVMPKEDAMPIGSTEPPTWQPPGYVDADRTRRRQQSAGIVLIALGLLFLAAQSGLLWWISFRYLWPLILIAVGVGILLRQGTWRR